MPALKNQHFVPRCHLRPFTLDGENLAINLFNFARRRAVLNAPVKNQCSADYFYGKDLHYEKKMQVIEGLYGAAITRICGSGYALTGDDLELFRAFWVLQHLRTEAASRAFAALSAEVVDTTGAPEEFRTSIAQTVQVVMSAVPEMVSVVEDLKVCLLRNRTAVDFITSDDPAIHTNRWYLRPGNERLGAPGLAKSGALCLIPLTPRHFFIAYDGDVYSLPVSNHWVDVRKESDVNMLNQQQLLNAVANVYFRETSDVTSIGRQFDATADRRIPCRHRLNHAILDWEDGVTKRYRVCTAEEARNHQDAIFHSETLYPRPSGWPDFIHWRASAATYSNGTGIGFVRRAHAETRTTSSQPFKKIRLDRINF
ncbi:uncharacterized protein DUF4238 [Stenotrophomonas rhizophila]|uniref:DUF4238 domain-containing protein n=1 Tax=Stenotrophomonas rhizophila TaxID=216778 RepID=UPI000F4CDEAB|nr:DUF4238 domain-containing protein [Stenotrophomonas rhizophila]ROP79410.1 uncharacterized protein DUF4238 [Stenotrophomonas rhizophila]